jgi:hypothetical protein
LFVAENDDNLSLKSSRLQGTSAAPGGPFAESFDNLVTLTRHANISTTTLLMR